MAGSEKPRPHAQGWGGACCLSKLSHPAQEGPQASVRPDYLFKASGTRPSLPNLKGGGRGEEGAGLGELFQVENSAPWRIPAGSQKPQLPELQQRGGQARPGLCRTPHPPGLAPLPAPPHSRGTPLPVLQPPPHSQAPESRLRDSTSLNRETEPEATPSLPTSHRDDSGGRPGGDLRTGTEGLWDGEQWPSSGRGLCGPGDRGVQCSNSHLQAPCRSRGTGPPLLPFTQEKGRMPSTPPNWG